MTVPKESGRFYFINKTEASSHLSRCLPREQAAIQRYVQTGRKRHRPSKKKQPPGQGSQTTAVESQSDHPDRAPRRSWSDDRKRVAGSIRSWGNDPESELIGQEKRTASDQSSSPASSLQAVLGGHDPFDAASIRLDDTVLGLLHYYVYYYHPTLWPNEMVVLKYGLYTFHSAMQTVLKMAVASELSMYCLLGAAACRMQHIDKLSCAPVMRHESFYMYRATGLLASCIGQGLFEADSRQLLLCIMFLLSAEAYRDNISAARTHLHAVCRVLEPVGGLAAVQDESLQNRLAMADLFLACVEMEPCLFECFYDPGPPTSLGLQDAELLPHPERLSNMASALVTGGTAVPPELRTLIEDLAESYAVKCRIDTASMTAKRVLEVTHWVTTRNMAIRNKLLSLSLSVAPARALRMAVIMWSLLVMNVTGRTKTVKIMAPSLLSILESTPAAEWARCLDVKLWIQIVGFQCAAQGSRKADRFASQIRSLGECFFTWPAHSQDGCVGLASQLSDRLEQFQMRFFFDNEVQRSRTHVLALRTLQMAIE